MTTWDNIVSEIDVHTFQLSRKLEVGQTYTASLLGDNLGPVVVQLGEEVAVGALDENNSLTFTLQEPVESTEISFLLGKNSGEVIRAKLEKGHKATDWTEAPEDVDAQLSEIRQTAEEISLSVEDQGRDLRSEIKLTADEITGTVEDKERDLNSRITQTAGEITSMVEDKERGLNTKISQTAGEITSMVEDKERGLNTKISQTAGEITREFEDELSGAVASIEESARGITSRVSGIEEDIGDTSGLRYSISTEIRQTKSSITQEILDAQNNAISRINLSQEGAKIYGSKIDLQGLVSIWNRDGSSRTQIDGDKITTGTIHGDKITAGTIHGNKITAGTIHGNRIISGTIDGDDFTSIDGGKIRTNTLHGNRVVANTLEGNRIKAKTLHGDRIIGGTIHGDKITAGTISADRIGAGTLEGVTIRTSTRVRNYIRLREQMLTFTAGAYEKMEIGFDSKDGWTEEPFIRMGVGDGYENDMFNMRKNNGNIDMSYQTNSGRSRIRMNVDGTVNLDAARRFYVNSPLQFSSTEILNTRSTDYPVIRIKARGNMVFGSGRSGAGETMEVRDGIGGSSRSIKLPGLEGYTTSNAANVRITDQWHIVRVTSAKKYKRDIEEISSEYAENFFYNAKPVWFRSRGKADNPEHSFYGYIADDVAKIEPRLATYSSYGEVEGFAYERVPALLHKVMLDQAEEIETLKNKIDAVFNKLKNS